MKNFLYLFSIITILFFYSNIIAIEKSILTTQNTLRPQLTSNTQEGKARIANVLANFSSSHEEAPNISESKIPHNVVNERIKEFITQKRLVEVSLGPNNEVIAKIIESDKKFDLPENLSDKLCGAIKILRNSYNFFSNVEIGQFREELKKDGIPPDVNDLFYTFINDTFGGELFDYHRLDSSSKEYIEQQFLNLLAKAIQTKINIVLKSPLVSEKGEVITHARRGLTSPRLGYAVTIGEWYLDGTDKLNIAKLIIEEAKHFGNKKVHGIIKQIKDFDTIIQHYSRVYKPEYISDIIESHGPWMPLYQGIMVGKDASIINIFKTIDTIKNQDKTASILIVGASGLGKSMLAGTLGKPITRYSAGYLSALSGDKLISDIAVIIKKVSKEKGVFIIDNFEDASDTIDTPTFTGGVLL